MSRKPEEPDFDADIEIDEDALDVEWLEQPKRFMDWCEKLAHAKKLVDRCKLKQDMVEAEISSDIRLNPGKYGLEKITEAAIRTAMILSKEYQDVVKEMIGLKYDSEVLVGAVKSFDQRKTALENLVKLHGQSYFAGPSVSRDLHHEVNARKENRKNAVNNVKERREERKDK